MKRNDRCISCDGGLYDGELVKVTRELPATISASKERSDGKAEILSILSEVTAHANCRKTYTRPSSVAACI